MPSRRELANAIRVLAMDAVQKAKSGHPGAPMGMADIAEVLWNDYMRHNPNNPKWANRDRFVLSNGHGSMLIYALLHLTGYDLPIEELKNFRQLHSKTPGHPEYGYTPGVETTTGPLGQGIANAVGMALAEKVLGAQFNRDGHNIIDHYTYVFLGDGCMMEGVSHEACALAGTFKLGKLVAFWDDNGISIDGEVEGWFTDDTAKRFEAYGWHVIRGVDGHNPDAIKAAIDEARNVTDKPSLICCKTIIGYGSPNKQGKEECHGAPLGEDEIALAREFLGWPYPPFEIPKEIYDAWDAREKGAAWEKEWQDKLAAYRADLPDLADELQRRLEGRLPADWPSIAEDYIREVNEKAETVATRKASQNTLNAYAPHLPEFFGGSADLTGSNLTNWKGCKDLNMPGNSHEDGNYVHYGVREFGMAAIMNGVYLHGGFRPFGGTFHVFSDYCRNGIRMSALMKLPVIYVLTHDSIGLGEDGPTHQPVEHHGSLRMIPNLHLWRPADAVETAVAWREAVNQTATPSALALSRQGLPHLERTPEQIENIAKGAYVLRDCDGKPDAIIIATGSEVHLADEAAKVLADEGKKVRVVSMPCEDVFEAQSAEYKESVLPSDVTARVAVEAGATDGWYKYVGLNGKVVGLDRFGESAPGGVLMKEFGFTVDNVANAVREVLS
ncbi:transketolase [Methylomarinovum caldicuralii]|uniref:Transketolase n=1 Tax=Methylomarinovum caldicuralii TaxID=438856 RepID=A0AAU9CHS2_9GAMM|nr:transketolase [Methylomarinovum caldicuralii]BCX82550.1 transketolase [Methylomarinovum caldicuralii]